MAVDRDFWQLAARFVEFVHRETGMPLIVCDGEGVIREAVDRRRIGTSHAGSVKILRGEVDEWAVTAEEAAANPAVREGFNAPIVIDGVRVGTFGIGGAIAEARPLARISAAVLAAWMGDLGRARGLAEGAERVHGGVATLSGRIEAASARSTAAAGISGRASALAAEKLTAADEVVRTVHGIAQQSRMLAINASVEATRAGDGGRAFGVLAREMLALADDARDASARIGLTLGEIRGALGQLEEAARGSAASAGEQLATLREVLTLLEALEGAVGKLARPLDRGERG